MAKVMRGVFIVISSRSSRAKPEFELSVRVKEQEHHRSV